MNTDLELIRFATTVVTYYYLLLAYALAGCMLLLLLITYYVIVMLLDHHDDEVSILNIIMDAIRPWKQYIAIYIGPTRQQSIYIAIYCFGIIINIYCIIL